VTIFKNGTLLTDAGDIDAANAVIAGATYENITSCEPEQVPVDASVCYEQTVITPGTPGTPEVDGTFGVQSNFPVIRPMDGSGTLAETVYGQEYRTDREEDGQYMLRDGANNYSGSAGAYALAFNFAIGRPLPERFYGQKLIGTPGQTYKVGYFARERAANPAGNFRVDVLDGASVIATGTSGPIATTYTNYKSSSFVMPAAGFVTIEMYSLTAGSGSGNDPLLDDIGLWTVTAAVPGTPETTTTVTYRKVTSNGVDTYYDEDNNEVTGTALTTLLADIAAGEYEVVPCATCGCGPEDIFPAGVDGQVWTVQPDGSFAWETPAAAVTCKGAHYEQLTLVPDVAQTITHDFGMANVLAIGYSVRGVDGSTVGDWPTGVRFINHTATTVDIIADGIGGIVDVALFNTECLSEVVTEGTASGGSGDCDCADGADGADGKSAYEVAVENGFTGTEAEWLESIKGADGADGKSAYEVAVAGGFVGTEAEWLESIKGADGADGKSAYEVAVENGFTGTEAEWLESIKGADGADGADGKSAYEVAVENGFVGTEAEWLESLKGEAGTGTGTTEVADGTTITGVGTAADPFTVANPVPAGGTDGQVLTAQPDGSLAWETPTGGGTGTTEVADGVTITGTGTAADPFTVADPAVPTVVFSATNSAAVVGHQSTTPITTGWTERVNVGGGTFSGGAYTIPSDGAYKVTFYARFATADWPAKAEATATIRLNGAAIAAASDIYPAAITADAHNTGTAEVVRNMVAGDVITASIWQEAGSNRTLAADLYNHFIVERVA
jgi:hypothetical protein